MKDKICFICHTAIDTNNEYCEFKHYKRKDEIKSKAYYHVNCFRDKLKGSVVANKLAEDAMKMMKVAKEKLGMENKQEVII